MMQSFEISTAPTYQMFRFQAQKSECTVVQVSSFLINDLFRFSLDF